MKLFKKNKDNQINQNLNQNNELSTLVICDEKNSNNDQFTTEISNLIIDNNLSKKVIKHEIDLTDSVKAQKLILKLKYDIYDIVIFYYCDSIIKDLLPIPRNKNGKLFIIIYSNKANESAIFRETLFNLKCNMVTKDIKSIQNVYKTISTAKAPKNPPNQLVYQCPYPNCGLSNLTEVDLWWHVPLYHIGISNKTKCQCPICNQWDNPFQVHIRNKHGLCATHKCEPEFKKGVPSYIFSLVVVRRKTDNKFLLVQEFASCGFWLPGGRVDPGEGTEEAALRETEEEAGVKIKLKGILKIEFKAIKYVNSKNIHQPQHDYNRMRVIYYGEPDLGDDDDDDNDIQVDNKDNDDNDNDNNQILAKSIPDYESMGACWVTPDELDKIKLRSYEPSHWIPYVASKGNIYPMELLDVEQRTQFFG